MTGDRYYFFKFCRILRLCTLIYITLFRKNLLHSNQYSRKICGNHTVGGGVGALPSILSISNRSNILEWATDYSRKFAARYENHRERASEKYVLKSGEKSEQRDLSVLE